jgi:hypothetical protein
MNTPCHETRRPSAITWRVRLTATLTIIFTCLDGVWIWRADQPDAKPSRGHKSYPAAMAQARAVHDLPPIGESGQHITHLDQATV